MGFSVVPPEMKPEDMFLEKETDRGDGNECLTVA